MKLRRWHQQPSRGPARLLILAALVAAPLSFAVPSLALAASESPSGVAALDARAWLSRIHTAAASGNYQGTMVSTVAGTMSSSRVMHFFVADQTYEQLEMLDGRQQRILRHNDTVQTVWPQAKTAVLERRETLGAWSTTPQEVQPQALENYDIRREADSRVAGREVAVFILEPRDMLRYPQRLWADMATGLMLRADVIGLPVPNGANAPREVLESTAFSEVAIGVKPQPELVTQGLQIAKKLEGYRVVRPQQQRTSLEAEGWTQAAGVPGFKLAGCVRRGMDATGTDEPPVLQAVFSDGLTHVSVFVEAFRPQRHRGEALGQRGATATLMQRRGDFWVTVVGDVPPASLRLFAATLERRRP
jgi:sigma-E factor negative regulatory protein RseB